MAMGTDELLAFVSRFRSLQAQRDASDELIKDLLIYCERVETGLRNENQRLLGELTDAQLDLADATKSRRDLQQRLQQMETRISYLSQDNDILKNRNPYVVVLIDGDGLLFKESFIRQGVEGGKKAAYALRQAIANECGDHADDIEIIAKVCANLSGLTRAMRRDGCLDMDSELKDFTLGFTQGKASFDFIDVGHGKERADSKIKEATRWNLRNVNCKQVILGISHDAGYAPFMDEILRDEETRRRITILEGFPTVRELVATGVNILNLTETLFRCEKLIDRTSRLPTPPSVTSPRPSVVTSPHPSVVSPQAEQQQQLALLPLPAPSTSPSTSSTTPALAAAAPAPASAPASVPGPPGLPGPPLPPPSYAGVISSASPPPTLVLPLQAKQQAQQQAQQAKAAAAAAAARWNPGPRGLDPPIQVNQGVLDNIKKRKDREKLCNNHYLRGPCSKGDACCFEHKYRPTQEEKTAIAFLARLNPCTNGQDCEVDDCIYGHHCPSVRDGQCTHPYCKFRPDEHPPNTKFRPTYSFNEY